MGIDLFYDKRNLTRNGKLVNIVSVQFDELTHQSISSFSALISVLWHFSFSLIQLLLIRLVYYKLVESCSVKSILPGCSLFMIMLVSCIHVCQVFLNAEHTNRAYFNNVKEHSKLNVSSVLAMIIKFPLHTWQELAQSHCLVICYNEHPSSKTTLHITIILHI